mgnify:CR=1 FL=1
MKISVWTWSSCKRITESLSKRTRWKKNLRVPKDTMEIRSIQTTSCNNMTWTQTPSSKQVAKHFPFNLNPKHPRINSRFQPRPTNPPKVCTPNGSSPRTCEVTTPKQMKTSLVPGLPTNYTIARLPIKKRIDSIILIPDSETTKISIRKNMWTQGNRRFISKVGKRLGLGIWGEAKRARSPDRSCLPEEAIVCLDRRRIQVGWGSSPGRSGFLLGI